MKIVLKRKWMDRPRGHVLNVSETMANRLIRWGTARPYDEEKDGESAKAAKHIDEAPRDKMLRGASATK